MTTATLSVPPNKRDKMCFWSTAGTPNLLGPALPDTLRLATFLLFFCYFFAIHLLSHRPSGPPFATLLLLSPLFLRSINKAR